MAHIEGKPAVKLSKCDPMALPVATAIVARSFLMEKPAMVVGYYYKNQRVFKLIAEKMAGI